MSISKIPILELKRQEYVDRIVNARSKIKKSERAHGSLSTFKTQVLKSQEDFHAINSGKDSILSGVSGVMNYSKCAKKYYSGMKNILEGIGTKIIGVVYTVLIASISVKLKSYSKSVTDCDDEIRYCNKKITEIDKQIDAIKKAEIAKITM